MFILILLLTGNKAYFLMLSRLGNNFNRQPFEIFFTENRL